MNKRQKNEPGSRTKNMPNRKKRQQWSIETRVSHRERTEKKPFFFFLFYININEKNKKRWRKENHCFDD
jgi:hypothetical protein